MDADTLTRLHAFIQEQSLPMYSMLIVWHGVLVFEHYYQQQKVSSPLWLALLFAKTHFTFLTRPYLTSYG